MQAIDFLMTITGYLVWLIIIIGGIFIGIPYFVESHKEAKEQKMREARLARKKEFDEAVEKAVEKKLKEAEEEKAREKEKAEWAEKPLSEKPF